MHVGGDPAISLYGTSGTPTHLALSKEILKEEGGAGVVLSQSGLAAITVALLAVVKTGDHVLIVDSVYTPLRNIALRFLPRMGVSFEFYDPAIGKGISELIRPNTRCVWIESPGSLTFEVQVRPRSAP
jgi:cystathionine beta-lyase